MIGTFVSSKPKRAGSPRAGTRLNTGTASVKTPAVGGQVERHQRHPIAVSAGHALRVLADRREVDIRALRDRVGIAEEARAAMRSSGSSRARARRCTARVRRRSFRASRSDRAWSSAGTGESRRWSRASRLRSSGSVHSSSIPKGVGSSLTVIGRSERRRWREFFAACVFPAADADCVLFTGGRRRQHFDGDHDPAAG